MEKLIIIVLIVVIVLILIRRFHIISLRQMQYPVDTDHILFDRLPVAILVAVVIYWILTIWRGRSHHCHDGSRTERRGEYGFFSQKKPVSSAIPTRTNYGNPMKSQSYVPRSGIATAPKTNNSRIFRQANG